LIRLRDYNGEVFEVQMKNQKRNIYANNIRHIKKMKLLYRWKPYVKYDNLTIEELQKSMKLADKAIRRRRQLKIKKEDKFEVNKPLKIYLQNAVTSEMF